MDYNDNIAYVEKRAREADDAERRRDVLAAQNARRYEAIRKAVQRIDGIVRGSSLTLAEAGVLIAVSDDLERANRVRESDPLPCEYLFERRLLSLAPPITFEIVSVEEKEVAA
ncbi:MAG: hypothetical protein M3348_11040 [Acidobacteriota bacterium]|nr:hypothetical protein [Acidobacteriota bacterium]